MDLWKLGGGFSAGFASDLANRKLSAKVPMAGTIAAGVTIVGAFVGMGSLRGDMRSLAEGAMYGAAGYLGAKLSESMPFGTTSMARVQRIHQPMTAPAPIQAYNPVGSELSI